VTFAGPMWKPVRKTAAQRQAERRDGNGWRTAAKVNKSDLRMDGPYAVVTGARWKS
jgi:hypothetical protein